MDCASRYGGLTCETPSKLCTRACAGHADCDGFGCDLYCDVSHASPVCRLTSEVCGRCRSDADCGSRAGDLFCDTGQEYCTRTCAVDADCAGFGCELGCDTTAAPPVCRPNTPAMCRPCVDDPDDCLGTEGRLICGVMTKTCTHQCATDQDCFGRTCGRFGFCECP
jgi:hypothetical protein